MLIKNKQIAIVGGGPGGLTLARLLQMNGAIVKLHERDASALARLIGSPLDMHENAGMAALRKANLAEAFKKNFRIGAEKKIVTNKLAEIFFSDHQAGINEDIDGAHFNPEIDRGSLRKILLESLQPETVVWNSHFISMEAEKEGWLLHFKNGYTAYADLVIAADGAHSKIRPYITGITSFYSGITMLEISVHHAKKIVPSIYAMLDGGKVMAFGNGKCILGGQKGNGQLGFYASFKTNEKWAANSGLDFTDRKQILEWFKIEYAGWADTWYQLFENAAVPFIPRSIYCMPPDQTWKTLSNATMIGDAAHVMPPFAGEGANTAMFDALELSECLSSGEYGNLQEAISTFEIKMRDRASKAAQQSLENGEHMHSEGALEKMLAVLNKK